MGEKKSVTIFGGNGFVGVHAAQQLVNDGADVVCLSRTGHKPLYLKDEPWSNNVRWCKGDASAPNIEALSQADVMVCSVGSPPLPTFSKAAFDQQLFMNGTTCVNAIEAANKAGLKRIVLLGAKVPFPLRSKHFAYYQGKKMALDAAQRFAGESAEHSAVVLQPGMITGRRALSNGRFIRLDWLTAPLSQLMPWQFVSVERVAQRISDAVHSPSSSSAGACLVIANRDI